MSGASAAPDTPSGILTYVEAEFNEPGLDSPRSIAVSPNGLAVYVTGYNDDSLAVFYRINGGGLRLGDVARDGIDGVDGLNGASAVAVDSLGLSIYVASNIDHSVAVFTHTQPYWSLLNLQSLKDGVGGVDGLHGAHSIDISADGAHVYVASNVDDAVAVFSRDSTSGALTFVEAEKDGLGGVEGLDGAYSVAVQGNKVYAVGKDDHAVVVFERNSTTGALTYLTEAREGVNLVDGLSDPISVAVSPDGLHTYATGSTDDALVMMQYVGGSWNWLFYKGAMRDGVGGVDGLNYAYAVTVSPDGNYVYATGEIDDALVIFKRDSASGYLTYIDMVDDVGGLAGPKAVAVSPDGRHVYAVSDNIQGVEGNNAIAAFGRKSTGRLDFVQSLQDGIGGVHGLADAQSLAISPDGKHVYTTSFEDDALGIFSRNSATGELTYLGMVQEGVGNPPIEGLTGAQGIAVSPDGEYVYATGWIDDALVIFNRNDDTGALTWAGTLKDGVSGVDGDSALAVFERDRATGQPIYLGMEKDGVNGVYGLEGISAVAASPDGRHVYAAGTTDQSLVVFDRGLSLMYLPIVLRNFQD